jgi:hypothetical protein
MPSRKDQAIEIGNICDYFMTRVDSLMGRIGRPARSGRQVRLGATKEQETSPEGRITLPLRTSFWGRYSLGRPTERPTPCNDPEAYAAWLGKVSMGQCASGTTRTPSAHGCAFSPLER